MRLPVTQPNIKTSHNAVWLEQRGGKVKERPYHPESGLPVMRWRVHTQAQWPRIYETIGGAIRFLMERGPLWFILEREIDDGVWERVVDSAESRIARFEEFVEDTN